jgi:hypothetical protein
MCVSEDEELSWKAISHDIFILVGILPLAGCFNLVGIDVDIDIYDNEAYYKLVGSKLKR